MLEIRGTILLCSSSYIANCLRFCEDARGDFLNAPFFYPWPNATNFSETHWGDALTYIVARASGANYYLAYQRWFAAGYIFTFVSSNWCLRKFGISPLGAAAGAFLFAFPLPLDAWFPHTQMIYRLWVPPAALAFDWFLTRRSLKSGACAFLCFALQLSVSIYVGLFLLLFLILYATASLTVGRKRWLRQSVFDIQASFGNLMTTGLLLVSGAIVLAFVITPYIEVQRLYMFTRDWDDVASGLPRLPSYLLAGASRLWPHFSGIFPGPLAGEQQLFPGLSALVALGCFSVLPTLRARHPLASVMLTTLGLIHNNNLCSRNYALPPDLLHPRLRRSAGARPHHPCDDVSTGGLAWPPHR